jgi:amidophosphoribosyltransferase
MTDYRNAPSRPVPDSDSVPTLRTNPFDDDHLHEECGVFGIYGHPDSAAHTVLGLHALQHRGQEAAGIVAFDGRQFNAHRALGHVADNFNSENVIERLKGHAAIGHTRYATTGATIRCSLSWSSAALPSPTTEI